jgi:hypothetical protein
MIMYKKRPIHQTLIILIFLAGLFIVSVSTRFSEGFWKTQYQLEGVMQELRSVKEETLSHLQGKSTNIICLIEDKKEMRAELSNTSSVSVEINKQEYRHGEEIVVTITNNLDSRITTFDQQAFCSIVRLERQSGTEWQEVRNCFSGPPSRFITLEPHTETVVKLGQLLSLSPGIYRASIIFSLGETFNFGQSFVVSSSPFRVQ